MATQIRKKKPVIVAESNFLSARLMMASLQNVGFSLVVARNGDEVVRLIAAYRCELLILNMNIGRPSGLELLRLLKVRQETIPIMVITAVGQAELKAAAGAMGVRAFFDLPFVPEDLCQRVTEIVGAP